MPDFDWLGIPAEFTEPVTMLGFPAVMAEPGDGLPKPRERKPRPSKTGRRQRRDPDRYGPDPATTGPADDH